MIEKDLLRSVSEDQVFGRCAVMLGCAGTQCAAVTFHAKKGVWDSCVEPRKYLRGRAERVFVRAKLGDLSYLMAVLRFRYAYAYRIGFERPEFRSVYGVCHAHELSRRQVLSVLTLVVYV